MPVTTRAHRGSEPQVPPKRKRGRPSLASIAAAAAAAAAAGGGSDTAKRVKTEALSPDANNAALGTRRAKSLSAVSPVSSPAQAALRRIRDKAREREQRIQEMEKMKEKEIRMKKEAAKIKEKNQLEGDVKGKELKLKDKSLKRKDKDLRFKVNKLKLKEKDMKAKPRSRQISGKSSETKASKSDMIELCELRRNAVSPIITDGTSFAISQEEMMRQANLSLDSFCSLIKSKCVLSERWSINEPRLDPTVKMPVILFLEIDANLEGGLRIKRCVKVLQDRSFRVLIDNVELTHLFDLNKMINTTQDVDKLLYTVLMKKVCQGLRSYDPCDPALLKGDLQVRQRGKAWYSTECSIVIQKMFMGNSCSSCQKVRNQIRRRVQAENRRKGLSRPLKLMKTSFGKAVYTVLNEFSGRGPIPPSQFPRENMVYDDKLGVHLSQALLNRIAVASTMAPPTYLRRGAASSRRNRKNLGRTSHPFIAHPLLGHQILPVQEFITEDGQLCYVTNVVDSMHQPGNVGIAELGWDQMVVQKVEPPDYGNVLVNENGFIIQNPPHDEFTLEEGEAYELIGEAPTAIEPIEILPADNQQIQIIEVDDTTMEQIEVHNTTENMQIAAVDPNDPNLSSLLRAFQNQVQELAL